MVKHDTAKPPPLRVVDTQRGVEPPPRDPLEGYSLFRRGRAVRRAVASAGDDVDGAAMSARRALSAPNPDKVWDALLPVDLDAARLSAEGIFVEGQGTPATAAFDILRTRLLPKMAERGWRRLAITSPTHGCGKTLVAANLALSLARKPSCRVALIDLELRFPALARVLGLSGIGPLRDFLAGTAPLEAQLRRHGDNLALGLNGQPVPNAAELLQEAGTAETLAAVIDRLAPDIVLYDLPPALGSDDVIAVLPQVDAVLLVADADQTTAEDIRACQQMLEGRRPLIGVALNRVQGRTQGRYRYGKSPG